MPFLVSHGQACLFLGMALLAGQQPLTADGQLEDGSYFAESKPSAAGRQEPPPAIQWADGAGVLPPAKLTGDWFALRTDLQDNGISVDVNTTQFYQGVAAGGLQREFLYGGRNDYYATLDGERAGLWEGFHVKLHGETRYGDSVNFSTGAYTSVNSYLLVPDKEGTASGLTGVKFSQYVNDQLLIYAGKINLLDEIQQPMTGASGLDGFMNITLIFNTILARTLPYSAFGAGMVVLHEEHPLLALSVYDTRDAATTSVFDELFTNGAVIFGIGVLPTEIFGLPGHQGIEAVWSSGSYANITETLYLDPVAGLVFPGPPQAGTWAVGYLFDQALWVSPDDPNRMWGIFGRVGWSDGSPNPLRWTAIAGVSGTSPLPSRSQDQFGAACFYLGVSDRLKQAALPVSPLGNEQGVELYYNARVKPWFQLTPNLQVIDPFEQLADTALVLGMRAKLDF